MNKILVIIFICLLAYLAGCGSEDSDIPVSGSEELVIPVKGMTHIGKNQYGYNEYKHDQTEMIFIHIPGGTFKMGSNEYKDEKPIHEVTLNSFLISKYETTQEVWQKIMGYNPSYFENGVAPNDYYILENKTLLEALQMAWQKIMGNNLSFYKKYSPSAVTPTGQAGNYPIETVSYDECQEFCKKTGLRLPTEAEWEYAARAGTTTRFYWGDKENGDYMWYSRNSGYTTQPVGGKKPNGFGLYDMSGNVWEFCQGWYGKYTSNAQTNPIGPASGDYRVLRGGSWFRYAAVSCRVTSRFRGNNPDDRDSTEGFRCAVSVK